MRDIIGAEGEQSLITLFNEVGFYFFINFHITFIYFVYEDKGFIYSTIAFLEFHSYLGVVLINLKKEYHRYSKPFVDGLLQKKIKQCAV